MGIGTSLGAYFETPLDHHAGNEYLANPNSTPDNNELSTNEVMPKPDEEPKVIPISDIKTASPLVTITDEDIDKGIGLGLSFSGGGLTTTEGKVLQMRKKAANDNVPDLVNPNLTPVEQLARKLAETENGKGSWDRIGGGGQEHYWRDAEKALKQRRPLDYDGIDRSDMIAIQEAFVAKQQKISDLYGERAKLHEIRKERDWSDIDLARFNKIGKEINEVSGDPSAAPKIDEPLKKYETAKTLDDLYKQFEEFKIEK